MYNHKEGQERKGVVTRSHQEHLGSKGVHWGTLLTECLSSTEPSQKSELRGINKDYSLNGKSASVQYLFHNSSVVKGGIWASRCQVYGDKRISHLR